jgi:hypothetical protein
VLHAHKDVLVVIIVIVVKYVDHNLYMMYIQTNVYKCVEMVNVSYYNVMMAITMMVMAVQEIVRYNPIIYVQVVIQIALIIAISINQIK